MSRPLARGLDKPNQRWWVLFDRARLAASLAETRLAGGFDKLNQRIRHRSAFPQSSVELVETSLARGFELNQRIEHGLVLPRS